jgi:hypothetical protein
MDSGKDDEGKMNGNGLVREKLRGLFRKFSPARPGVAITVALIVGPLGFLFFQCYDSPDVPFIFNHAGAAWIRFPEPVSTYTRGYKDRVHFTKDFYLDQDPESPIFVHLQAFREFKLYVNGYPIYAESPYGKNWKKGMKIEISPWVKSGANSIRAHVENPMGPALLWLRIEGLKDLIATDETWKARTESSPSIQAILAEDIRANPDSLTLPTPYQSINKKGTTIFWIFAASVGLWGIGGFFFHGRRVKILIKVALAVIVMIWVYLFLSKMVRVGPAIGFDISHHLDYLLLILRKRAIPLASDDWATFHPPLFYLLSFGFLEILKPFYSLVKPFHFLKVIPFLCGLGNVWVAYALGRMVFKDDPFRLLLVIVVAGFIPMNIYMSAYVGNEPLHAFLVGCSLVMAVHIFRSSEVRFPHMIYLGLLLGLAVLTKITAWAILPVVVVFLAYKMTRMDGKNFKEVTSRLALFILVMTVICGWYYIRNIIHFGRPFMINWDLPGQRWWQDPGFHTIQYFLSFGEALRHPYFSAFHSFWDAMYSTFWGDGLIGGLALIAKRPDVWNYDYMSAVYLLALPATGIFLIGLLKAVDAALNDRDPNSKLIMAFLMISLYSVGLFILFSTLRVPIYGQAKAFYCLAAVGPISVFFALGLGMVNDWLSSSRLLAARAVFYGWFGSLLTSIYLSFAG